MIRVKGSFSSELRQLVIIAQSLVLAVGPGDHPPVSQSAGGGDPLRLIESINYVLMERKIKNYHCNSCFNSV